MPQYACYILQLQPNVALILESIRTFSPTTPCEAVHTRKHRVILHEAEPGYWMLLVLEKYMHRHMGKWTLTSTVS